MLKEVSDQLQMLKYVHQGIDKMLEGLTEEELLRSPGEGFNPIASIIDHVAKVERKFLAAVAGEQLDIDTGAPFKASTWDVTAIKRDFQEVLAFSESVLAEVTESQLNEVGLTVGGGEVDKRQLITFAIFHAAHHRGQIPLLKKWIQSGK